MDLQNMDLQGGSLQISTEVVGKIARCAALEVDGVAEVSCGVQNKKLKSPGSTAFWEFCSQYPAACGG